MIAADLEPERLGGVAPFTQIPSKGGFVKDIQDGHKHMSRDFLSTAVMERVPSLGLMVPASPFSRFPIVPSSILCVSFAQHGLLLLFFNPGAYPQSLKQCLVSLLILKIYPSSTRAGPGECE